MCTGMFIEMPFIIVKGTGNNANVHQKKNGYINYIHTLEYYIVFYSENEGITAKCTNMPHLSGT